MFLLVLGPNGQWWRGFLLLTLLVIMLLGLLVVAGWTGGALGAACLTALAVPRRRR